MVIARRVRNLLVPLWQRRSVAVFGFAAGAAVWLAVGSFWPKHYTGTALFTANLAPSVTPAAASPIGSHSQPAPLAAELQRTVMQLDWTGMVRRELLPPALPENNLAAQAAFLASQISVEPVIGTDAGETARVTYSGSDRDTVSIVINEIATSLSMPAASAPVAKITQEPLYAPVILPDFKPAPKVALRHPRNKSPRGARSGKKHKRVAAPDLPDAAELSAAMQASVSDGVRLQDALNQNGNTLNGLEAEWSERQQHLQAAPAPTRSPAASERKPTPQEERLRQDLTRAQRELAILRDRYTDEYPDVVNATEKVQDLLLDISRISAVAKPNSVGPQPSSAPLPAVTPVRSATDLGALRKQVDAAEAAQARLQAAIDRNHRETAMLQAKLAAAGPIHSSSDTAVDQLPTDSNSLGHAPDSNAGFSNQNPNPVAAANVPGSTFFLVRQPEITAQPFLFATKFLWPLSLVFGILAAFLAAWLAERRDPSIRNEIMLRHELPASAVYLGGIPRIRHEIIAD